MGGYVCGKKYFEALLCTKIFPAKEDIIGRACGT
jgi:hypothetical protein